MKKHFLNPSDMILAIVGLGFSGAVLLAAAVATVVEILQASPEASVWVLVCIYLFPMLLGTMFLFYMNKYKGYLYVGDDSLILEKGNKRIQFAIADIKWIELKHDVRGGRARPAPKHWEWKFLIRLNYQKQPLDFLVTNSVVVDIIEKHKIRIMPDEYQKAYLEGKMDLRLKKFQRKH